MARSVIELPSDYVVIDIETTGLDFEYDNIIELAAIKFKNNIEIERYSTLVKPPKLNVFLPSCGEWTSAYVSAEITELTGITNDDLETAPTIEEVLSDFVTFIGDAIIVGQNTHFDISFIRAACDRLSLLPVENEFINIMRIAHKVFPGQSHYRLEDIAKLCNVQPARAHRALADCETVGAAYLIMRQAVLDKMTVDEFKALFAERRPSFSSFLKTLDFDNIVEDTEGLFFNRVIVFTGELEKMTRREAAVLVSKLGGVPANNITKKTNFLVVGNYDYIKSIKSGQTSKMRKAQEYAAKGYDIIILSENTFYQMLDM